MTSFKDLAFRVYAAVYNTAALLPVKENRVVLFNLMHGGFEGALTETERELKEISGTPGHKKLELVKVDRNNLYRGVWPLLKFMTVDAFRMGRAQVLFFNNNFFPMGYMRPNQKTKVVQIWHGQGAFKKFGLDIPQPPDVREKEVGANRNVSYVTCSAENIRPIYMSAFGLSSDQVLTTGNPVSDYFFREENVGEEALLKKRKAFEEIYPVCRDKYLVLYAPTFRDEAEEDAALLSHIHLPALQKAASVGAGKEAVVLVRLHPNDSASRGLLKEAVAVSPDLLDVTDYPDGNELTLLSDVLVTDYSSICMNHALLSKPLVFYAYDLEKFSGDRNFYFPYEETVGGPVCKTMEELVKVFETADFQTEKLKAFRTLHFGDFQGGATKAMLDRLPL